MRKIAATVLLLSTLQSCALPPPKPAATSASLFKLRDGAWLGQIDITGVLANNAKIGKSGRVLAKTSTFMVTVCDSKAIFWTRLDNGSFRAAAREENFTYRSNHSNHLISLENYDQESEPTPEWVETQTMLLVELNDGSLRAQWSRGVSNPLLGETEPDRNFFWTGVGTLAQVASECPREMMKSRVDD